MAEARAPEDLTGADHWLARERHHRWVAGLRARVRRLRASRSAAVSSWETERSRRLLLELALARRGQTMPERRSRMRPRRTRQAWVRLVRPT